MKNGMKSINDIYIWRIIFTLMILFFHLNNYINIHMTGWYIATDFFFIVSGYLLYQKKDKYNNSFNYLLDKYKKIYPIYLLAFITTSIVVIVFNKSLWNLSELRIFLFENFQEMLMIQGLCLGRGWNYINPVSWYIPLMIMAGFLYVFLLKIDKKIGERFLIPLIMAYSFAMIFKNSYCMDLTISSSNHFMNNPPLHRALLGMGLGIYANIFNNYLEDNCINYSRRLFIKISGLLSLLSVIICSVPWLYSKMDYVYIVLLFYGVSTAFIKWSDKDSKSKSGFISKIVMYISSITVNMYLLHEIFRAYIMPRVLFTGKDYTITYKIWIIIVYLFFVVATSILFDLFVKLIKRLIRK